MISSPPRPTTSIGALLTGAALAASMLLAGTGLRAQTVSPASAARPRLTGYFPQWGLYNDPQYTVKNLVTSHSAELLDQLNYAQGFVTDGHCSIADPYSDMNVTFSAEQSVDGVADSPLQHFRGNFNQMMKLKRRHPGLKLIISLEGRGSDFAYDAQPEHREAFVRSCVDLFVKGNIAPGIQMPGLFDGIDVDWEYPRGESSADFLALLTALRQALDATRPGLLLTIAVGPSPQMYEGSDFAAISRVVDEVGLMTYDFAGPWNSTTGFLAPFSLPAERRGGSVTRTVQAFRDAGVPVAKLLVGLPFYGYGWHQVLEDNNGLFQEGQPIRGDRSYRELESVVRGSTIFRDPDSQAPWLFDGDVFWTYDDPVSIRFKSNYVSTQGLGGVMIWELGEDSDSAALLHSAYEGLKTRVPAAGELPRPVAQKIH